MLVMTSGEGITIPDKVIFANWKRLNDASWSYPTSTARNFNLLPYSVNDSAVSQYYEPRKLSRGSTMTVTICLGKYTPAGFALKKPAEAPVVAAAAPAVEQPAVVQPPIVELPPVVEPVPVAELPAPSPEAPAARVQPNVRADMAAVNALIAEIDVHIAAGREAVEADIERLKAALAELKGRASAYPSGAAPGTTGE